jgi:hypothetical protein
MKYLTTLVFALLIASPCFAGDVAYRTGGKQFAGAWHAFYDLSDHEPEIDDPLIKRGASMVPAICQAVAHKDMKYRRYAIGALGYIRDKKALPTLQAILKDGAEIDYFRGDALRSIYLIDRNLGTSYAQQYQHESGYLAMLSGAILKKKPWLLEPSGE